MPDASSLETPEKEELIRILKGKLQDLSDREDELTQLVGEEFDQDIVQYIKLTVRETKDLEPLTKPALAGIQLLQIDGTYAQFSDAWSSAWSSMIKPENLIDDDPATCWRDEKLKNVIIELKEPAALLGYRFLSSKEDPGADPTMWYLEGSKEKDSDWHLLHEVSDPDEEYVPEERGHWSVLIPFRELEGLSDMLVQTIMAGDSHELVSAKSKSTIQKATEAAATGPTKEELMRMQVDKKVKAEALAREGMGFGEKQAELEDYQKKIKDFKSASDYFYRRLRTEVHELATMVMAKMDEGLHQTNPTGSVEALLDIGKSREDELKRIHTEIDASQKADRQLTERITALQTRCQRVLPELREECDSTKQGMYSSFRKETRQLEAKLAELEVANKELLFHTKRGTNFKDDWKEKAVKGGDWTEASLGMKEAEAMRRQIDTEAELTSDLQRLRREYANIAGQHRRQKQKHNEEMAELKRAFNEAHKDRNQLGQERCELEAICADFAGVIERLQSQLRPQQRMPGQSAGVYTRGRLISPIATKYTIGNGRLTPRPSASPRRTARSMSENYARMSPRPHARTPMTPR